MIEIPISKGGDWLLWLCQRRRLMRVTNRSMLPLLRPGQRVFVDINAYRDTPPQTDDIVVAWHPQKPTQPIIKRVDAVFSDGRCFLLSENPSEGTDSRSFGAIPPDKILGRVTSRTYG